MGPWQPGPRQRVTTDVGIESDDGGRLDPKPSLRSVNSAKGGLTRTRVGFKNRGSPGRLG